MNELLRKSDVNYSELAIDFLKFLVDRQPMNDPRWTPDRLSHIGEFINFSGAMIYFEILDQKAWLREQSPAKSLLYFGFSSQCSTFLDLMLIIDQLEDKLNHYKMFNLFLQHFNLLDKVCFSYIFAVITYYI